MKVILLSLFILSLSLLGAEPKVVSLDKIEYRNKSGSHLVYIANQDTPFTGIAVSFFANGQKRKELTYKNGKSDGLSSGWFKNGKKSWERNYKEGKYDGLVAFWYESGQNKMVSNYKNGQHHGLWTKWYENGQIKGTGNHKEGSQHEHWVGWYDNGRLRDEVYYNGGLMERAIVWKPDGKKCPITKVEAGSGVMVGYNQDGTEFGRFTYEKGEFSHWKLSSRSSP